jgi:hypothetical protein
MIRISKASPCSETILGNTNPSHATILLFDSDNEYLDQFNKIITNTLSPGKVYIHCNDSTGLDEYPNCEIHCSDITRTKALSEMLSKAFLDGFTSVNITTSDSIIQNTTISTHYDQLRVNEPIITNGKLRSKESRWRDAREMTHPAIFKDNGLIINNPDIIKDGILLKLDNIGINKLAYDKICKFNEKYYGEASFLPKDYDDTRYNSLHIIGIIAYYCRIFMVTINSQSSGVQISKKNVINDTWKKNSDEYVEKAIKNLHKKVNMLPLTIKSFI